MVAEAEALQERQKILLDTAVWLAKETDKLCATTAAQIDEMSDEERSRHITKLNELLGRNIQAVEELLKNDTKYHDLKDRVNAEYGCQLLPDSPRIRREDFAS